MHVLIKNQINSINIGVKFVFFCQISYSIQVEVSSKFH